MKAGALRSTTRSFGAEAEMELPFAALQTLCVPMLDLLDRLPPPQRAAIETAFGVSSGAPPEQLLVGLAALVLDEPSHQHSGCPGQGMAAAGGSHLAN
jgi:hypothetical protein